MLKYFVCDILHRSCVFLIDHEVNPISFTMNAHLFPVFMCAFEILFTIINNTFICNKILCNNDIVVHYYFVKYFTNARIIILCQHIKSPLLFEGK